MESRIYIHLIAKKRTIALCTIALWRINQQWSLHRILISWNLWYMYLHLIFLIMTAFYKPRKTSLSIYHDYIHGHIGNAVANTLPAMFVLTGYDTLSLFLPLVQKSHTWTGLQARSLSCWASIRFRTAYPSLRDVKRKAE